MTRFLLVRHATNDTVGKLLAGRMEGVSLNEEGRRQSQKLADMLGHLPIKAIYVTPLQRTSETAAPLAERLQLTPIVDEDFLEIDFGRWTGVSFAELNEEPLFKLFNSFRSSTRALGGELMVEAQMRIVRGMEKLCEQHPAETVVIISHADMIKAAVLYYAGMHIDMFLRIEVSPASVTLVEVYKETARIMLLNSTGEITI